MPANVQGGRGASFSNISATPANFTLLSGRYAISAYATWGGGSVTLNLVDIAGNLIPLVVFSGNGYATVDVASGLYQLTIATATAVYSAIAATEASRG